MNPDRIRAELDAILQTKAAFWQDVHAMVSTQHRRPDAEMAEQSEKPQAVAQATNSRKLRRVRHLLRQGLTARAISIAFGMPEAEIEEQQMQVAAAASRTRVQLVRNS